MKGWNKDLSGVEPNQTLQRWQAYLQQCCRSVCKACHKCNTGCPGLVTETVAIEAMYKQDKQLDVIPPHPYRFFIQR